MWFESTIPHLFQGGLLMSYLAVSEKLGLLLYKIYSSVPGDNEKLEEIAVVIADANRTIDDIINYVEPEVQPEPLLPKEPEPDLPEEPPLP